MPRRLPHASAAVIGALLLGSCGSSPAAAPVDPQHPAWSAVATIVCPDDASGSVAEHKVTCTDEKGQPLEAAFYEQSVDLDRRVSTFECKNAVNSVAGRDWMVPAVTDQDKIARLLDAGGINLC
ncbi:hypothetical protein GCM10027053_48350 [Intrasporangium mesophilum]